MKTFGNAIREDKTQKVNFLLIPVYCLRRLALRFMLGASLHGADNWKGGNEEFKLGCRESAYRHFLSWIEGEEDEDHAFATIWNIMVYEYLNNIK